MFLKLWKRKYIFLFEDYFYCQEFLSCSLLITGRTICDENNITVDETRVFYSGESISVIDSRNFNLKFQSCSPFLPWRYRRSSILESMFGSFFKNIEYAFFYSSIQENLEIFDRFHFFVCYTCYNSVIF